MRHPIPTSISLRITRLFLLVVLAATQPGCLSSKLAGAFTDAPNGGPNDRPSTTESNLPLPERYDAVATLDVPGPPPITTAYWIKHPTTGQPPQATVLLIHGWASKVRSADLMQGVTQALADAGCRVILPDLRGHGDSTGDFVTSGFREVQDLHLLLNHLDTQGQLAGPLGVAGHSYGGGIAIQFAARDPRTQRALAFSPLADIRPAMLPGVRYVLREKYALLYTLFFQFLITPNVIADAQTKMQERTGADLAVYNALHHMPHLKVPLLIVQGDQDIATPLFGAQALRDANPQHTTLHRYADGDHVNYFANHHADLQHRVTGWAQALIASPTPPPSSISLKPPPPPSAD